MTSLGSLTEFVASQDELVREAALTLPHEFSRCTYSLGPIRQAVYLCLTCELPRGLCSSCSIACHTDHEQIELFPKRNFRCDCPTTAVPHGCTLHRGLEEENRENSYNQNFRSIFCRCSRPYDPTSERETMIQCLTCEDWFHESCLHLRVRPSSREASPVLENEVTDHHNDAGDNQSEASSSGLPPPLISAEDYDAFVCSSCVHSIDILRRYAGTQGVIMVVRDAEDSPWKKLGGIPLGADAPTTTEDELLDVDDSLAAPGQKRSRTQSLHLEEPDRKKQHISPEPSSPCLAPAPNPIAQTISQGLQRPSDTKASLGAGDVFLTEGWRERWCRCSRCFPSLADRPYLLEEEETYEPPEDPDSALSLEELGMRALQRLPRDRAIDGIRAFNDMRDDLLAYLRPFAQEGRIVGEADVKEFFEALRENKHSS
ncbi:uncharacterized protein EDB91DRAFT_1167056 [Suillus paluster]|uniref:uncharacterized protein n=1 Tax=Suillus paluster TaxID=48578 RepID=UPI001B8812DA|nr:uncharacterized protein EDB91DRAFT_1167056 [Suillus paluster]KAG1725877.1 hypothetical protein EDB91DRAFT_1167056 [Suillus paluster]